MKNWKTSIAGIATIAAGVALLITGKVTEGITAITAGAGLLASKDHNVTGGEVNQ